MGDCVLIDRLGGGRWSETCLAQVVGQSTDRRVLKRLVVPSDILPAVSARLKSLVKASEGVCHPGIVAPRAVRRLGSELVLGSRYVDGPTLNDLLVRRGRFPSEVVAEIGAGLVDALGEFEAVGLVHGDLQTGNVRLGPDGRAVAVDAGIAIAVEPGLVVDVTRPPSAYDGVAPERIAESGAATVTSDMYSLGCLLFELLAGRPPFPVADVVTKINLHQSGSIADVRDWAPDVTAELAEQVARLCSHDVRDRPTSWRELQKTWHSRSGRGQRQTRRFRKQMRSAAPVVQIAGRANRRRKAPVIAGTVLAVAVAALTWMGQRLEFVGGPTVATGSTDSEAVVASVVDEVSPRSDEKSQLLTWPTADNDGVVRLDTTREWGGVRLTDHESIVVVGSPREDGGRPEIVVRAGKPLVLDAPRVELKGVTVRGPAGEPWVVTRGGIVRISDCRFVADPDANDELNSVGLEVSASSGQEGVFVECHKMVVHRLARAVRIRSARAEVTAIDCLQVGGESWLDWMRPVSSNAGGLEFDLVHCTLRRCRRLLSWSEGPVRIGADECVLAIRPGEVLCELRRPPSGTVQLHGRGTLLTPGVVVSRGNATVEGLVAAVPTFRGPATKDPRDSKLSRVPAGVPGVGGEAPGVR
ncbi:protein kinase [Planctomycetaceae bacterium]|nr:protein kinase [Planctomycetaceae bacterium]